MPTVSRERLVEVFVEVADTLVDDFDLIEFLHMVVNRTTEIVDVEAVGLLLADQHEQLQFVAASDEATRLLELFQLQSEEGPCLDAFRTRTPVIVADLREAVTKWPAFAPRAIAAGFFAVHAIPLRLRSVVVGALNLFGVEPGGLGAADVAIVQAVADVATIGLLQERSIRRGETLTGQLQTALNTRVTIEQAKGALAQMRQVSVDEAFALLRGYARSNGRKLSEVALAVVKAPASVPGLIVAASD